MQPAAILAILVEANTKAANANLAKTDAQLRGTAAAATATTGATAETGAAMRKLGTIAKWGGAALAAGFVIEAKKAVTTTQDLTKSTLSLHKNLGLTNKVASEWAGVAKARGVDTTKLGMAFKTLATQISSAGHGSATTVAMFKELGFSNRDIQRSMTDTQFAIGKVSDGLNALPAGADKAAFSGKLFGRGWQTIAPILRDGSAALQDQLDTVEKYGGVLEGKTLKQQEALLANVRENKIAWQGFQVTLASAVTPALNTVSDQFQRIAAINADPHLTGEEKWKRITTIVERDFSKALDVAVKLIPTFAEHVGQAAPKIAGALVKGFLGANIWGKLAIGAFLVSKLGGWGAINAIGSRIGTRIGAGIAEGEAVGGAAGGAGAAAGGASAASRFARRLPIIGAVAIAVKLLDDSLEHADKQTKTFVHMAEGMKALGRVTDDFGHAAPKDIRQFTASWEHAGDSGLHVTGSLGDAINRLKHHYGSFAVAGRNLSKDQRNAWIDMAISARENGDITQRQLEKLTNAFTNVGQKNRRMWRDAAKATGQSTKSIKQSVGDMTVKVSDDYKGMVEVTGGGIRLLAKNTNKALGSLGVARSKFMASPAAHSPLGGTRNFQRGGLIPGQGDGDKVPVMAEPGEGFINKKAVRALGGKPAIDWINDKWRRHAAGGIVDRTGVQHLARGGMAAMVAEANRFERHHFPYRWGGGHGGFGIQPVDCSGAVSDILHAGGLLNAPMVSGDLARWGKPGKGNLTVYANPVHTFMSLGGKFFGTSGTNPGGGAGWMSDPGAAYRSGFAARTMPAAMIAELKRVILKGPAGALKDMGQGALDKTWKVAKRYINKQTPAGSFGGGQALGDWKGINSAAEFIPFWNAITGMKSFANAFAKIVPRESGWNPRASNGTHFGWYQFDSPTWKGFGKGPVTNAFNPGMATQAAGNVARIEGWPGVQSRWAQTFSGKRLGGVVVPYVGSFDKGGQVASTGLGLLHQGESVVPNLQRGGTVHRLHHQAHQLQHRIRSAEQRIEHQRTSEHPDKALIHHLNKLMHELEIHRETVKELISENKELRKESKADRRDRRETAANETPAFRALRNFIGREIGYQYAQSRRNAAPGSAVRY